MRRKTTQSDKIELTRAELDAINKYSEKVRQQAVREVISAVEELLEINKRMEHNRIEMSKSYVVEQIHKYAECLCVTLLMDLQAIEDKYTEEQK